MASLNNDAQNLRLSLELIDRESAPAAPGMQPRVLGSAGVEFLDRRDKQFWPVLRLPVVYFDAQDASALVRSIRELCAQAVPGFGLRAGSHAELALQLASQEGGGFVVEVGIDLAQYLLETSGRLGEPGRELALFRFTTGAAQLVVFADQIKRELEALPPLGGDGR